MTTVDRYSKLKAVIFDWAGTVVDYGSRAPVQVFQEIFRRCGIEITHNEARGPMGQAKRDHIAAVVALPRVAQLWYDVHCRWPDDNDVERMYAEFLPLQKETLARGSDVIEGVPAVISTCRARGLKIGSTTGYTRELMSVLTPLARRQGFDPQAVFCADDVPAGRPAPWMLFRAAEKLGVYPMSSVVAVDDTPVGIAAGLNAGTWTVAVAKTGNALGLSAAEVAGLPADELANRLRAIREAFLAGGAHYVVDSVADLLPVLDAIDGRAG